MTHDEMTGVIKADKEGKTIECSVKRGTPIWKEATNVHWNFLIYNYRVKPEQLRIWVNAYDTYVNPHDVEQIAVTNAERIVPIREVILLLVLVVGGLVFVAGIEVGRHQILNEVYVCEKGIDNKWQCKENK